MLEIDQDLVCESCQKNNETINRDTCEGCGCEEAREYYLDEAGIYLTDTNSKTFGNLTIGSIIYIINTDPHIPVICTKKVNKISHLDKDYFKVSYESEHVLIFDKDANSQDLLFLIKEDCNKKFEEICTDRIIKLSKIIGSIKK